MDLRFKLTFVRTPIVLAVFAFLHVSCASGPNKPYQGPYPDSFERIKASNALLVEELAKLPEIRDGIDEQETAALDALAGLYSHDPAAFDSAFSKMYEIGLPEHRKYCSPLQALFWLAEDRTLHRDIIAKYSLKELLSAAWDNEDAWKTLFTEDEKQRIIEGVKDDGKRSMYKAYFSNYDESTIKTLIADYSSNPSMFSWPVRRLIKKAQEEVDGGDARWGDYSTVVDRLNAPELFDYYVDENIVYKRDVAHGAYLTFKMKEGQCTDVAYFAKDSLTRSGYKVHLRSVRWGPDDWLDLHTGAYITRADGFYTIVADFTTYSNHLSEPLPNLLSVDHKLANYKNIIERCDCAFFPPRS